MILFKNDMISVIQQLEMRKDVLNMAGKILDPTVDQAVKTVKKVATVLAIVIIAAYVVLSAFYTVGETEAVVITTFGKASLVNEKGLHFKNLFMH